MMDGRLKTLHPKIHGGLLALRDNEAHMKAAAEHGIEMIDMVVVNLYRFEDTVAKKDCTLDEAIENIDIGGPTMLRAAAKNYRYVSVITDPADYSTVLEEMKKTGGKISEDTNFALAAKVFQLTARYDGAISNYLSSMSKDGPERRSRKLLLFSSSRPRIFGTEKTLISMQLFTGKQISPLCYGRCASAPGKRIVLQQYHGQRCRVADGFCF